MSGWLAEAGKLVSGLRTAGDGRAGSEVMATAGKEATFGDTAPSWEELKLEVEKQQAARGVPPVNLEEGQTSAKALLRTFGEKGEPRIVFYRDHASWCPYCHKIWLQLEEKRIPYRVVKVNMNCYGDKSRDFLSKVPRGLLPAMEIDGEMYTESAVIAAQLESMFPAYSPLLPPKNSPDYAAAQKLLRLERQLFSEWMGWLTSGGGDARMRAVFTSVVDDVDAELARRGGPFFLGEELSLVDITFVPFLERMAASLYYYKGLRLAGAGASWPNLQRWWVALDKRATFRGMKSDYFTHCHDLPPQLGGCAFNEEGRKIAAMIDGEDGTSWHLPLEPLSWQSLEPISWEETPELDRLEAAAAVVGNNNAVVRFAARGCAPAGSRPVRAPLADPSADKNVTDQTIPAADAALRLVVAALLTNEGQQVSAPLASSAELNAAQASASLAYLRDRVGVPRDMAFPAARQFRAHLNSLIDNLTRV
eukprot:CAMPEP_0196576202 /NCGR_PEP_ID=MMETSP1081-20130531/5527_1 /TAXON_ID=36882 /ORGANISM="Pyramimonas amylifera, Strain CCMP720" /LENGTH=477 /DNA_ID=CAMNT_0041894751 /DNA_START=244 /DNA_END=1677 /DNA_ORIENTATION=+